VLATVNLPESGLADALKESGLEVHAIGDCLATRQAPAAFFEGRRLGLRL
jgi:2,4-dienoyl-CoA reductase (NADPH2)